MIFKLSVLGTAKLLNIMFKKKQEDNQVGEARRRCGKLAMCRFKSGETRDLFIWNKLPCAFLFVCFCDEAAMKVIVLSYYDGVVHKAECKYGFME